MNPSTEEPPREAESVALVTVDGRRLEIASPSDVHLLDGAAEAGATLVAACRRGTCGSCRAHVAAGPYALDVCNEAALSEVERERRDVLLCRTYPLGPLTVELPYEYDRILFEAVPERRATLLSVRPLARRAVRLTLRLEADEHGAKGAQFEPGRFFELQPPDQEEWRAYSAAGTGNWDGLLEFFIKLRPGGVFSTYLTERAVPGDELRVRGPRGAFGTRDAGLRPRWLVAGGTGLAPLLSVVRQAAEWQEPQPTRLFAGFDAPADVFGAAELDAAAAQLDTFRYELWLRMPGGGTSPEVRSGTPVEGLAAALAETDAVPDIYVCGPPALVTAVEELLAEERPAARVFAERLLPS